MSEAVAVAIINVGVLWFLSLLAVHTDDENHAALKLFFILGSVWMAVNTIHLGAEMAEAAGLASDVLSAITTNFYIIIVMAVVTSFYFTLYYIKSVIDTINKLVFRRRNKTDG